jgi:hypothetical protein
MSMIFPQLCVDGFKATALQYALAAYKTGSFIPISYDLKAVADIAAP